MKRVLFGLLLLSAIGALGCETQPSNNNATPNVNASPASSPTLGGGSPPIFEEVVVTITISDKAGVPFVANVLPDPATVPAGMRVQWVVDNKSVLPAGQNATVEIGSFKGKASPSDTKPFGPDPCDNKFVLNFLKEGKQSREISEQAQFQAGENGYSYEVILKAADGSELGRYPKMPEIIVGGMVVKPEASPSASPKASPTRKPR